MTALALETFSLCRTFGSGATAIHALRGVDLAVCAGEFVALVGPSGCGKSTLLNLAAGLDQATSGEVLVQGRHVGALSEAKRAALRRQSIGIVFQFFNLVPSLTVGENVELPALLAGVTAREARSRREALLERLGLAAVARSAPSRLSGGQQQRVAVARALINAPALLLADEPTGNLESQSAREVLALLREGRSAGQALLLSTHDPRIAATADRIVTLRDGVVVDDSALAERESRELELRRGVEAGAGARR